MPSSYPDSKTIHICHRHTVCFLLLLLLLLAGCATNPVTGRNELILIPESMELDLGQKNYQPARQMQGGDYVVHPAVTEYVREVGHKLADVSDRKLPYEFSVLNNPEINAWAMPGGKIAINRGLLLKMDNEAELAAVLGHEIVHAAARHGAKHIQKAILLQGAVLATNLFIEDQTNSKLTKTLGVVGAQVAASLLNTKFSRDDEREADHYGMLYMSRAGYDPEAAVSLHKILLKESNAGNNLLTRLLSDHPISQERINSAESYAEKLPEGGRRDKDRYHRRLAALFHDAPAYESYDKAQKAFDSGNYGAARSLVDRSIKIQPKEAIFHLLKGSIFEHTYKEKGALNEYRMAAHLNPGYYKTHLKLGLLLDAMGERGRARIALRNSVRLLKTAAAMRLLGRYALDEGNYAGAKAYLKQAAESTTGEGRAAFADLLRIDLPSNAGAYLDAGLALSRDGLLQVMVRNNTPFPVGNIVVEVRDNAGTRRIYLDGVVGPNKEGVFNTGLMSTRRTISASAVSVVSARLSGTSLR